jgi:hypothetical protein
MLSVPLRLGVVAVSRDAGHVFDDRDVSPDNAVEQGGFADVGPAYYGDDRFRHNIWGKHEILIAKS